MGHVVAAGRVTVAGRGGSVRVVTNGTSLDWCFRAGDASIQITLDFPDGLESEEFDVPPPPPQLLAHRLTLIMSELLGEDILEAFGWMQGRATVFATEGDPDSDGEELRDLFAVLGLAQSASEDEVRAAWKEQVAKERAAFTSTSTDGDAFGRVRLLNRARDILVDDSKRKTYIFLRDFQKEDGDFAQEFRADRDRQMQQQQEQQRYLQQEQQRYLMAQQQQQQQQQRMLQQQQYAYYQQQQQQQQRQHSPRSADYGMFRRHTRYDSSDSSSEDSKDSTDGAVYFTPRVSAAAPSSARNTRYTASQRAQPVTASHVRQASAEHLRRTTQARLRRQGTASPMAHSQAEEGALRQEHLRLLHNVRARLSMLRQLSPQAAHMMLRSSEMKREVDKLRQTTADLYGSSGYSSSRERLH